MSRPDPSAPAPQSPDAELPPYETLIDALLAAPPDKPFVTMWRDEDDIETVNFGRFRELVFAQAAFLRSAGVKPQDRVILIMDQGVPLMATFAAAFHLGAAPAILAYPNLKMDPAKYRFGLAGVSANLKARLAVLDEKFPEELLGHVGLEGGAEFVRALNAPPDVSAPPPSHARADQLAFIQHSAGTTGLQKGVGLTHRAVLSHLRRLAPALALSPSDRIYSWLPLYHDMGLIACFMLPLVFHLELVMQSPNDWVMQPSTMLELIDSRRCTLAWVPNFALQFLARRVRPRDRSFDLSSLRALINCSEPVRASSIDEFRSAYQDSGLASTAVQSCYAMAETVFAATQSDLTRPPTRAWISSDIIRKQHRAEPVSSADPAAVCFVSSGLPIPGVEIRIDSPAARESARS